MGLSEASKIIEKHINELDIQIKNAKDNTNKAILQNAKSTALLSLAKILVG